MTSRTGSKGFTLIELLVAASVLTVGTLFVHQGLLRAASLLNHTANLLAVDRFASEAFWQAREGLFYAEPDNAPPASGSFTENGREFRWGIKTEAAPAAKDCFELKLNVEWNEGNRPVGYSKSVYAAK